MQKPRWCWNRFHLYDDHYFVHGGGILSRCVQLGDYLCELTYTFLDFGIFLYGISAVCCWYKKPGNFYKKTYKLHAQTEERSIPLNEKYDAMVWYFLRLVDMIIEGNFFIGKLQVHLLYFFCEESNMAGKK